MKTIAITMDEESLQKLDELENVTDKNRSELIREAVSRYLTERERLESERKETGIFRKNRRKLHRQAAALIREQGK